MNGVAKYHLKEYGVEPEIIIEAPQVMTLFGAFSDCINGYALMSTNDYGMRIAVSKRDDNTVKILNVTKQDKKKFIVTNIKYRKEDRWANAAKAILYELVMSGYQLGGMNITIKGPSAIGDNFSLCASIFSGLLVAVNSIYGLNIDADMMLKLAYSANGFSELFQTRLRDLITIFTAKKDNVIFFDLESYEYKMFEYPFNSIPGVKSFLLSTSLPYSVLTPEMEEFRLSVLSLMQDVKSRLPKNFKIRELSDHQIRQELRLKPEIQRRQLMYVVEESELARQAGEAMESKDYETFSKLMVSLQKNLFTKAELTTPEIDWIVRKCGETEGVLGISQVFVGLSGTLITLIDSNIDIAYTCRLEEYERIFGFHATIRPYVPCGGVRRIEIDEDSSC